MNSAAFANQVVAGFAKHLKRFVVAGAVHDSLLFCATNIGGFIFDVDNVVTDVDFQLVVKDKTFFTIHSSTLLTISCSIRNLTVTTTDLLAFTSLLQLLLLLASSLLRNRKTDMSEKHQRSAKWIDRRTVINILTETCQLLNTACTYRAISYLSDFQVLA